MNNFKKAITWIGPGPFCCLTFLLMPFALAYPPSLAREGIYWPTFTLIPAMFLFGILTTLSNEYREKLNGLQG
jgi:hypothetical protein